ncbi:MAG: RNase adapter RapZ [Planctomycetota bacterium]
MEAARPGVVRLMSFGFKYGQPPANYYFDVSFAKNPARQAQWGLFGIIDDAMRDFVLGQPPVSSFIELVVPLIAHVATVDSYQTVAIGCNAGRHRSPIIAGEVHQQLFDRGIFCKLEHRDLGDYADFMAQLHRRDFGE